MAILAAVEHSLISYTKSIFRAHRRIKFWYPGNLRPRASACIRHIGYTKMAVELAAAGAVF